MGGKIGLSFILDQQTLSSAVSGAGRTGIQASYDCLQAGDYLQE
jgi:hypothetical protein